MCNIINECINIIINNINVILLILMANINIMCV